MPPKRKPRNAFFIFTTEWKSAQQRRGSAYSIAEATRLAGEIWKDMTPAERSPYNEKAKNEKYDLKNANEKYTSNGIPLSFIENERKSEEMSEKMMKNTIEEMVNRSLENMSLPDQKYYFMMGNYFSKTIDSGIYIPAEIGVSEYSLREGVTKKFHSYVNPKVSLFGHAYETHVHTESSHQLPLPPNALGESQMGLLYNRILNFINPTGEANMPPVFTLQENMPIMKSILNFMKCDSDAKEVELDVFSIHYLFFTLKKATTEIAGIPPPASIYVTTGYFDQGLFEYHDGIACEYHEKLDKSKYCALAYAVRWGFIFSNYMCVDIDVDLKDGAHVPMDTNATMSIGYTSTSNFDTDNHSVVSSDVTSRISYIKEEPREHPAMFQTNEFPSLGGGARRKTKFNRSHDDSDDAAEDSPWRVRGKNVPRQPQESSFDFDFDNVVTGQGRGLAIREPLNESRPFSIRGRGALIGQRAAGPSGGRQDQKNYDIESNKRRKY